MSRLLIHVEGQTEETFVKEVLAEHLHSVGFEAVGVRLLGNARQRSRRGGIQGWPSSSADIIRHFLSDQGLHCSTMVDYYALPAEGQKGWPGRAEAGRLPFERKANSVEEGVLADVVAQLGPGFRPERFVPYVMMHEFEAMLFSDCRCFADSIGRPNLANRFQEIRDQFSTPEEINDSPDTAPSKRVAELVPGYEKPFLGTIAALGIGLDKIRSECPHFHEWICRLEAIVA